MLALITRKLGMVSMIGEGGRMVPLTLLEASPNTILQVKTAERDGYWALQLGYGNKKSAAKPQLGHLKAAKAEPPAACREIRFGADPGEEFKVGSQLKVDLFSVGDDVEVVGTAKGRGFAGPIKRHNFKSQRKSHGAKGYTRRPGSIGSMYPQRVMKGKKMAGRLGGQRVTVSGLKVGLVDVERGVLGVVGGLPGPQKSLVIVRQIKAAEGK